MFKNSHSKGMRGNFGGWLLVSGVLVDKDSRRVLAFKSTEKCSIKEIIENNGFDSKNVEFIENSKLQIEIFEIRDFHKIYPDGTVEDTRPANEMDKCPNCNGEMEYSVEGMECCGFREVLTCKRCHYRTFIS